MTKKILDGKVIKDKNKKTISSADGSCESQVEPLILSSHDVWLWVYMRVAHDRC